MKIKSIKIEKLFEIFDYEITYPENEDVLIITGPNGFGKTQILNILFHLFNERFWFFHQLVFNEITLFLERNILIKIEKKLNSKEILFNFFKNNIELDSYSYVIAKANNKLLRLIRRSFPIPKSEYLEAIEENLQNSFISKYLNFLSDEDVDSLIEIESKIIKGICNSVNVHLIREQRLFKQVRKYRNRHSRYNFERNEKIMTATIEIYAEELHELINDISQTSFAISQKLDSTYPRRLIFEKGKISEEEYNQRFTEVKDKQEKLIKYGLYETEINALEYNQADAKALLVYLNDLEEKISVFDELLEKLELFTTILNERRFTFKTIEISKNGFVFRTSKGKELNLTQLSSGEQHEVVILYELIFNTTPNTLVLIDEPEISLHVNWQKEFLKDLLKIVKMQKIQVMIATHSPSIINDRWDLVYTLTKNDKV